MVNQRKYALANCISFSWGAYVGYVFVFSGKSLLINILMFWITVVIIFNFLNWMVGRWK